MTPTRPVLRWHGGKWMLAPWIIDHFPPHRVYTEAYGGAASVLLRKPRAYAEVYNDLDGEVVNLFRVLQDRAARARLHELLRVTPFARAEFLICRRKVSDRVERARRLIMRSGMGFGSNSHNMALSTGFRVRVRKTGANVAQDWAKYPDAIESFAERFRGVTIESRPALQVIQQHDGSSTLHYVDPPYVHGTRAPGRRQHDYVHEMTDADHRALAAVLSTVRGGGSPLRVSVAPLRGTVCGLAPRRAGGSSGRRAEADRGPVDQRRGVERRREAPVMEPMPRPRRKCCDVALRWLGFHLYRCAGACGQIYARRPA